MPKAHRRKDSSFASTQVKSVFLYGRPNREKLSAIMKIQQKYQDLVNQDIRILSENAGITMQLVQNNKKNPEMRRLEKSMRVSKYNSAFCQNAFDEAVTHLSNRYDSIRLDMYSSLRNIFCQSKALFAMAVDGCTRSAMIAAMQSLACKTRPFYQECADALHSMTEESFAVQMMEFQDLYASACLEFRIPKLHGVSVPLDSRLMKIEPSAHIAAPYVITLSDPFHKNSRIQIPLDTSRHSLHKIQSNAMAGTVMMQVRGGSVRIGWSYERKLGQPKTSKIAGVDTGILDALHTSEMGPVGSMKEVLNFYHGTVEPAFAELSKLRNKKRSICHYVRSHPGIPADVRRSLIRKADRLEHMMQTMEAPYRKKRHYYGMLGQEIHAAVNAYIRSVGRDTLTVLEKLDIREFKKSRRVNGMFSIFARGKLQETLMSELNWRGYDFMEVVPDYTSQVCPECFNLDPKNRDGKVFSCTCCGHKDDADHNGSVNIKARADDKELLALCEKYKYQHKTLQGQMKILYTARNQQWKTQHPCEKPAA